MTSFSSCFSTLYCVLCFLILVDIDGCMPSAIRMGSRLLASDNQSWVSDNGTFAFGFTPATADSRDQFRLAIWFAEIPGDRVLVWSAYV